MRRLGRTGSERGGIAAALLRVVLGFAVLGLLAAAFTLWIYQRVLSTPFGETALAAVPLEPLPALRDGEPFPADAALDGRQPDAGPGGVDRSSAPAAPADAAAPRSVPDSTLERPPRAIVVRSEPDRPVLIVPPGQGVRAIAQALATAGLVAHPLPVEVYARATGIAARLQAGEYALAPDMTAATLLQQIHAGRVVARTVTVPEGWTFAQMLARLDAQPQLTGALSIDRDCLWALAGIDPAWVPLADHPELPPSAWIEGLFMPDTYQFRRGDSAQSVLERGVRAMGAALAEAFANRAEHHPAQTPWELLILASLVEKEAARADEREEIAGVFVNRLRAGMRLQTDPALLYGQPPDVRLTRAELRRDHPHNTYTRDGLPPTPIALPGRASLMAAARPADTEALFFVARGDGSHVFSATYTEHRRAVIEHQLGGDASRYGGRR